MNRNRPEQTVTENNRNTVTPPLGGKGGCYGYGFTAKSFCYGSGNQASFPLSEMSTKEIIPAPLIRLYARIGGIVTIFVTCFDSKR